MSGRNWALWLADFVIRHRWPVVFIALAVSIYLGVLGAGLPTNNSYEAWLPEKDRVSVLYQETDKAFSSNALVFVVLEFPVKGVFDRESLLEIRRVTELLETVPELFFVMSLTNIVDMRDTADGVWVGDLVKNAEMPPEAMNQLRDYVLSREMYVNSVVSEDGRYAGILMNIDGDYDEVGVAAKVLDLLEKNPGAARYYFGGDPALAHYMDRYMRRDMALLVPLMFLVMVFILGFGLRRFWGVVLPLSVVVLAILWTLGFQRIFDMPLNLLSPAVLVMLIALGSDYSVHSLNHYLRGGDLRRSSAEISVPIIMCAATTIAGLLTYATTQIRVLKDFGYEMAFGLGSACILTLTFLVASIHIARVRPEVSRDPEKGSSEETAGRMLEGEEDHIFGRVLERVTIRLLRHPRLFLAGIVVVVLFMAAGIFRIHTNVDFVTFLPEGSPPRIGHEILREHFGGIYPVSIYVRGDIEEPALLKIQLRMENALRSHPELSGFSSLASTIAEMNRLLTGAYAIPDERAGVAGLWLFLEGEPYLRPLVNEDRDKALINAMVRESDTGIMMGVADFVDRELPVETEDDILTVDISRLSPESRQAVIDLQQKEAARQLGALIAYYGSRSPGPETPLLDKIREAWHEARNQGWNDAIRNTLRGYLRDEAVSGLGVADEEQVLHQFKAHFPEDPPETWVPGLRSFLVSRAGLDPRDAERVTEGALLRCRDALRAERAGLFLRAIAGGLPPSLTENVDFRRKAEGVFWELMSERPVFLASSCAGIAGLEGAVTVRVPVKIDQSGAPSVFRAFDRLLYRSQVQSLLLATLVVFLLVAVTQKSIRRGFISIVAILVPLEIVIGLMGWVGIPLDFGTALCGALILGLGIDGCIHVMHYESGLNGEGLSESQSIVKTLRHVGRAVLIANATTAGGFGMLIFSVTRASRNFAIVNVMAIVLVTASILTLLPVLMKLSHLFAIPAGDKSGRATS